MRPRVRISLLLLAVGGCTHIPERIFIDVGGNTIEVIKKPTGAADGDRS